MYYFILFIEAIWLRIWLVSNIIGIELNKTGKLCNPFCKAYCNKFVTAGPLPKLIVGSYVWLVYMMAFTFDVRHDINW